MLCRCWPSSSMAWEHLDAAGCWTGPSSLRGPWLRLMCTSLWFLIFPETYSMNLTSSCGSLRPSGAISEPLCTPALPTHTESQQISGGQFSPSTCSSLLCQLCWRCDATSALLILWNLFPRGRPTAKRRKTRPRTSGHGHLRNMSHCEEANVFRGPLMAHKLR